MAKKAAENKVTEPQEVYLRRGILRTRLPQQMLREIKFPFSSIPDQNGNPMKGFTIAEEKKWMPYLLNISEDDPRFGILCNEYWADIFKAVPEDGILLNIRLDEEGNPVNIADYAIYRLAKKRIGIDVAENEQDAEEIYARYILEDPEKEMESIRKESEIEDNAQMEYLKIKTSKTAREQFLQILHSYNYFPDSTIDVADLGILVKEEMEQAPEVFLEKALDPDREMKAFIFQCVDAGVIQREGNIYLDGTVELGTLEKTVAFFKKAEHSEKYTTLKVRLKESI